MSKQTKNIVIIVVVLLVVVAAGLIWYNLPPKEEKIIVNSFADCVKAGYKVMGSYPRQCQTFDHITFTEDIGQLVGGDKDEHGCLGSAGYMWCEPKDKCLRIWEEACYQSLAEEIQYLLAKKYDKPASEVNITITKQEENFAGGAVKFGQGGVGEGGLFLAAKIDNVWEVVYDGNGSIDCHLMRQEYGFPDTILKPNFCD